MVGSFFVWLTKGCEGDVVVEWQVCVGDVGYGGDNYEEKCKNLKRIY